MDIKGKKIVIVEDDEHIAKIYKIQFDKGGILNFIASDGEEGLAMITAEKPDLVILDLMLPKKDGFWVLEEMKKNPDLSKISVIVLSNLGQKVDKDRAMALGAVEYLVKVDYSIGDIINKINTYLVA